MSDNNNRIKSSDNSIPDSESTDENRDDRKRWIRFEEQTNNEVYISISDGKSDGKCATIEPSNSVQMINPSENINNIPDSNKRSSSSPVSSVLSQQISNNGSNKTIINSSVDNKENVQSFGESSNQSSLKTLQNIPLKDTNNRNEQNQCNHSSTPNDVYCK